MATPQKDNSSQVPTGNTPAPELQALEVFAGKWRIEGKNFPLSSEGSEKAVFGEDTYRWLAGNFFLVAQWHHVVTGGGHQGISILSFESTKQELITKNYDNLGYERQYTLINHHPRWQYVGEQERAIREFSLDGSRYTEHWEVKDSSGEWQPLCVMQGTKVE